MNTSSLRLSAMKFLAIREHSVLELKNKLINKFPHSVQEIEQLLVQLQKDNLLSDERFTEIYFHSRMNKGYGPVKICYELALKGIPNDIIAYNMKINEENWMECMQKVWNKKFSKSKTNNNKYRIKQSRYLYQRGFSSEQIKAFMQS